MKDNVSILLGIVAICVLLAVAISAGFYGSYNTRIKFVAAVEAGLVETQNTGTNGEHWTRP